MRKFFPTFFALALLSIISSTYALGFRSAAEPESQRTQSTADKLAAEEVSLSADKILEIMKNEVGLMLEFKRTLVRKTYEQGRYLDPDDLTDDAVFELIRSDAKIRALATREIEARGYIRALPRQNDSDLARIHKIQGVPEAPAGTIKSREQAFWATHEVAPPIEYSAPSTTTPAQPQPQPAQPPAVTPSTDRRRELQQAEFDQPEMLGSTDLTRMSRVSPSELPGLLSGSGVTPASARSSLLEGADSFSNMPSPFAAENYSSLSSTPSPDIPSETQTSAPERRRSSRTVTASYSDRPLVQHRPNPYADVPSLYDLYSQVTKRSPTLRRFGSDIFVNGSGNTEDLPIDLPAGPEYVLGPGDSLNINLWGSVSERMRRVVDRTGRVGLPEIGSVMVAGKSLGDVQREIQAALRRQLRDVQVDVSLARLRTVRVYVVGDVVSPGPYDVSSLSTPLNALLEAGGPTARGSLRTIQHRRGDQLVQQIDVYDLLLHGVRADLKPLGAGDTILIPSMGPQVTVEGMVRRPAIYELNGAANLADVLELAGGVLTSGTLRHIDVERVQAHEGRTMVSLDLPETNDKDTILKAMIDFKIQDGDRVRISPILPYSNTTVYLDGHVFHPGKYPYHEGMKVTDLIHSYGDLLPEPAGSHAEIIRLSPPDFKPIVLAFNLADALAGKGDVPALKPFDTVRIFGRYDFEDPPEITVSGEVRTPGELLTNGQTRVRDAIYLAGGITPDAKLDDAQVYRRDPNGAMQVFSVNLGKALAGDSVANVLLAPKDRVIVHRNLTKYDPPAVTIQGEVARPGKYLLAENMTATDLVKLAGGFKRGAYTNSADLSRYVVENGRKVVGEHQEIAMAQALAGDPDSDVRLVDGDVLSIKQLSGWNQVSASVKVSGEVVHPSVYGIREGERLSSLLRRAGGLRAGAYAYGAVLERVQVREFAEKNRQELIHRIEGGENLKFKTEEAGLVQAAMLQQQAVLNALKNQTASGRLVIHISSDINRWANTPADIELRPGDTVLIPKRPNFVLVSGQVYNGSAISFVPGKSAGWYLEQAGGATNLADKRSIFVIRADGSVVGRSNNTAGGLWHGSVLSTKLQPGDTIIVPERFIGSSTWKEVLNAAQFASSIAIAARVATSF